MTDLLPPTNGRTPEARLLVVDDEPNIVELLSTSLRFAGFEVEERFYEIGSPSGLAALEAHLEERS